MFGFFKKKDDLNDFKLDDISLQSLSDSSNNGIESDSLNSVSNLSNDNLDGLSNNLNNNLDNNLNNLGNNSLSNNPISDNLSPNNTFNSLANTTPTFSNQSYDRNELIQSNINEVLNNKLDALESRSTLADARLTNIEHKLDVIYKILIEEISDSTKQKLNLENIQNTLNNKLN